ncbi:MAG: DUF3990 domain-containing protein, partial [archaeon]|nr:DUF3990 domain-containing protein [archaeon]
GFYVTQSYVQAEKWAKSVCRKRRSPTPFVTEYDYELKPDMKVLVFEGPTEAWFDFITQPYEGNVP